jgi:hypothetical protein
MACFRGKIKVQKGKGRKSMREIGLKEIIIHRISARRMRWVGHVACMGEREKSVQGFGGKAQRKKTTWKTEV